MAKKKSDKEAERKPASINKYSAFFRNETTHFVIGLVLVIFSVYLLLAFTPFFFTGAADQSIIDSENAQDLATVNNHVENYVGSWGVQLVSYLINDCFGVSSLFILIHLAVAGLKLMCVCMVRLWKWFIGCTLLLTWFSAFLGFIFMDHYQDSSVHLDGLHGYNISNWFTSQIDTPGVWPILLATGICFSIYMSVRTVIWLCKLFILSFLKRKQKEEHSEVKQDSDPRKYDNPRPQEVGFDVNRTFRQEVPVKKVEIPTVSDLLVESLSESPIVTESRNTVIDGNITMTLERTALDPVPPFRAEPVDNGPEFEIEAAVDDESYQETETKSRSPKLDLENYHFPTIDLMKYYENSEPTINMEEQNADKDCIINTLRSFGTEISTIKAAVGPTVTLYEITPERGVHISKIRGLEDDIALSLSALGTRIIAPIPGKGTIGIEVPNSNPKIVLGQSIIGSKRFQGSTYDLSITLDKTITNGVFMVDFCKMPHALVVGATGQGKSVGLNATITSLFYKKHPAELEFVLVDPKKVELSIYSVIEYHFLAELPDGEDAIITDVTKVMQTLNSVCVEMDSRYDLPKMIYVRNIKECNERFINRRLNPKKGHKSMSYIVVVINESGDLTMTAGKEIELLIARITQLVCAVDIRMIITTQCPITNTITGTIRTNFPVRTAFRVSAMMDPRTVLGRPGVNQLTGCGDMLFLQRADPVCVQCVFIDTPEAEEITKYISRQQGYPTAFFPPEYVSEDSGSDLGDVDTGRLDPLSEDAACLIVIHQRGSTSLIQRKFSIDYNRTGRLMDQLEKAGIAGPSQGSKARDVLCVNEDDLEMRLNNIQ